MKTVEFQIKFHLNICCLGFNWQYGRIVSDNGLAANRLQAIILTNDGLVYECIYASLGFSELKAEMVWQNTNIYLHLVLVLDNEIVQVVYILSHCKQRPTYFTQLILWPLMTWHHHMMPPHHQVTSHYLSQCWPRYISQYGITGPQWIRIYIIATTPLKGLS